MPTTPLYPFDVTGLAPGNLILAEQHTVNEANYRDYYFLVPFFAPFFAPGLVVTLVLPDNSLRVLVEGEDYYLGLPYLGATRSIGIPVYGAITLNHTINTGTIKLRYQTIGGDYTTDANVVLQNIADLVYNPRTCAWDVVTDKPVVFPPTVHQQPLDTVYGEQKLIDSIDALADTVANAPSTTIIINPTTGGGGSGGATVITPKVFDISAKQDSVLTNTVNKLLVSCFGADTPDTLFWTVMNWTSTAANFDASSGAVAVALTGGGLKTGVIDLLCTNATSTPVTFFVALRTDALNGPIVAVSELITITNGDGMLAPSGELVANNLLEVGFAFTSDRDTGVANPGSGILDLVTDGITVASFNINTNVQTFYFGTDHLHRLVLEANGVVRVLDETNAVVFSTVTAAKLSDISSGLSALQAILEAEIEAIKITPVKLHFLTQS